MENKVLKLGGGEITIYCPRNFPKNTEWKF